jgi:hypothetical protein
MTVGKALEALHMEQNPRFDPISARPLQEFIPGGKIAKHNTPQALFDAEILKLLKKTRQAC